MLIQSVSFGTVRPLLITGNSCPPGSSPDSTCSQLQPLHVLGAKAKDKPFAVIIDSKKSPFIVYNGPDDTNGSFVRARVVKIEQAALSLIKKAEDSSLKTQTTREEVVARMAKLKQRLYDRFAKRAENPPVSVSAEDIAKQQLPNNWLS